MIEKLAVYAPIFLPLMMLVVDLQLEVYLLINFLTLMLIVIISL